MTERDTPELSGRAARMYDTCYYHRPKLLDSWEYSSVCMEYMTTLLKYRTLTTPYLIYLSSHFICTHLIPSKQGRRAEKLRDTSERFLFSGLGRGQVKGRDEVVVSEARVRPCPQQGLHHSHMSAKNRVVERTPSHLSSPYRIIHTTSHQKHNAAIIGIVSKHTLYLVNTSTRNTYVCSMIIFVVYIQILVRKS